MFGLKHLGFAKRKENNYVIVSVLCELAAPTFLPIYLPTLVSNNRKINFYSGTNIVKQFCPSCCSKLLQDFGVLLFRYAECSLRLAKRGLGRGSLASTRGPGF